jgi:hypothetical protein
MARKKRTNPRSPMEKVERSAAQVEEYLAEGDCRMAAVSLLNARQTLGNIEVDLLNEGRGGEYDALEARLRNDLEAQLLNQCVVKPPGFFSRLFR